MSFSNLFSVISHATVVISPRNEYRKTCIWEILIIFSHEFLTILCELKKTMWNKPLIKREQTPKKRSFFKQRLRWERRLTRKEVIKKWIWPKVSMYIRSEFYPPNSNSCDRVLSVTVSVSNHRFHNLYNQILNKILSLWFNLNLPDISNTFLLQRLIPLTAHTEGPHSQQNTSESRHADKPSFERKKIINITHLEINHTRQNLLPS